MGFEGPSDREIIDNVSELSAEEERALIGPGEGTIQWKDAALDDPNNPVYQDLVYVGEVAVRPDPEYRGRGIGKQLYGELILANPYSDILAATVEMPVKNEAAAGFHAKLGFERIGQFNADKLLGLSPYQSGLWLRKSKSD